jgi:hypothetical protein
LVGADDCIADRIEGDPRALSLGVQSVLAGCARKDLPQHQAE